MSDRPNALGGLTAAQASANLTANLSAMACPTTHSNAVPVETVDGEVVAALCPDCDRQLPATWADPPTGTVRDFESEHRIDHHGYPAVFLIACRLCAEEQR